MGKEVNKLGKRRKKARETKGDLKWGFMWCITRPFDVVRAGENTHWTVRCSRFFLSFFAYLALAFTVGLAVSLGSRIFG
jgi:hypothetical protein